MQKTILMQTGMQQWEVIAEFARLEDAVAVLPTLARAVGATVKVAEGGNLPAGGLPRGVTLAANHYVARP